MLLLHGIHNIYKVIIHKGNRLYQIDFYINERCIDTFIVYGNDVIDNIIFHYRLQNIIFKQSTDDKNTYTTTFYNKIKFYKFITSLHTLECRYSMFIF